MTAASIEASNLDDETLMLVRIAALVAVGAPAVSYLMNLEVAGELDIDPEKVSGVLAAVAPIVGTARVAAATGNIVKALAIEIEVAELEAKRSTTRSRPCPRIVTRPVDGRLVGTGKIIGWGPKLGVWAWSFVGVVVATIIVVFAVAAVSEIVLPMTFAAVLAICFKPTVGMLERRGLKSTAAAGIIVLGLLALGIVVGVATVRGDH